MSGPASAERALVLAPHGRDAALAVALLAEAGMAAQACPDLPTLQGELDRGVGVAILTEETVRTADIRGLAAWIAAQPSWSDLPIVLLTGRGGGQERNPGAARLTDALGNVIFLERPFHPTTLVSVVRTALRGRRRQYEARARLDERERLLEALAGERTRFETLIEHLPVGVNLMDREGRTLLSNPAFRRYLPEAVIPSRLASAEQVWIGYDEHGVRLTRDRFVGARALNGETVAGIDFLHRPPGGPETWTRISGTPVRDAAGRMAGAITVIVDIDAQKRAQEALQRFAGTLETKVDERTRELAEALGRLRDEMQEREHAEAQLRQAQKLETLGQLTGGVAHDFNNLLTAVLGNIELLSKRLPADPAVRRLIDGAMQGARRGSLLTQRLLAFARRQELQPRPVDLAALVNDMTDLLERSVGPRVKLRIEASTALPPALIDPNQLELALLNLAVNARDAMPEGGTLTIALDMVQAAAQHGLTPGPYLRLAVRDTGTGMDAGTVERAVEPFFSTKGVGKGTGLGLSMVHGLAAQSGGDFRLSSTPGQGTTAELWLPVATTPIAAPLSAPVTAAEPVGPATILLVDDDALIAMSTADMLADLGHTVIEANSGAQALSVLRSGRAIDLLMTDYAMPGMTGAELARAAREIRPGLPMLLATGYAELPDGAATDLPQLAKPYMQSQLAEQVAKVLGAADGGGPRAASGHAGEPDGRPPG